jgi:WhiB family redox-sensing transcriptional regulator
VTLLALLNAPSFPDAQCMNEADADFFFPDSKVEWNHRLPRLQQLCGSCIHKTACLSFAINNNETEGFWGGMTPEERNHLTEKKKEAGTRRFREIQEYLSQGLTKEQVATMLKIQVASIERTLERAKKRGLTQ